VAVGMAGGVGTSQTLRLSAKSLVIFHSVKDEPCKVKVRPYGTRGSSMGLSLSTPEDQ
jgi:hypothetical protein